MKVAFIVECTLDGPDALIYPWLAKKFCPKLEIEKPKTLKRKVEVINEGPSVAKTFLDTGSDFVFFIWDRMPKFNGTGRCEDDKEKVENGLKLLGVNREKIVLCCIKDMLESWMLGDGNTITEYFQSFTIHRLKKFPDYKSEAEQSKPEEKLSRYSSKYNKYSHNFEIVKKIPNFDKIAKRNDSFKFFKESIELICGN